MMAHALAMRATSLVASAAILGAAVLVALSATYIVQRFPPPGIDTQIVELTPPEPPPPPPEPTVRNPNPPIDSAITTPLVTTPPIDQNAAPTPSLIAFPQVAGPVTIENPHWLQRPRNLARYYPRRALERGVEGFVMLDCAVSTVGLLSCNVISETPIGWNFGDAALRMAADHRMQPATRDGVAVEGRYRMRVPFALDQ